MKFLIEVDVAGCDGIHRQQVADVLAQVVEHSTITEAISNGLFESSLFDLSRLAKPQYEDGVCPDCSEPIPDDATYGDGCVNCEHAFIWGENESSDEPEGPGVQSLGLLDEGLRVGVDHLTVYVDPERGDECFMVDEDHADDEHGRRCPGSGGTRFDNPEDAGAHVARVLADLGNRDRFVCQDCGSVCYGEGDCLKHREKLGPAHNLFTDYEGNQYNVDEDDELQ